MSASVHDFPPKFNSSAFFDRETHPSIQDQVSQPSPVPHWVPVSLVYPQQVVLCRQIAKQLVCDESNAKSKGKALKGV